MSLEDRAVAQLRIPPHSEESECSVLGGLLLDNESLARVPDLKAEAFYRHEHQAIFRAIQAQAGIGRAFDVVTTWEWLQSHGEDEGGQLLPYLNSLTTYVPSAANTRRYAEIVKEKALLRAIVTAADETATAAFNTNGKTPTELLDAAQMRFAKLAAVRARREPQHIHQSLADYLQLLQELSEGKNPAIPTGIGGLDRLLNGGLRRGEMMVIGARPKHGKTALSLTLARNMAQRFCVLFISQEMPVSQLMHRHTAAMGSVDLGRILRADATDKGMWERVNEAAERLGRLNLVHDDQAAQSLMDVRRKAVKVKREHGLDVLFVDFLQLMQGAGGEDNRNRELDLIANGLKALALDLDVGVVLLSQMSRKADEHYGRPTMTHLRDSGAIEAAADQVAVLFTDHAHPLSPKHDNFAGYSELEIVAHRNGPQGLVPMHFVGQYQQIGDWMGEPPQRPSKSKERGM
jgi:replicative DNA helicase